MTHPDGQRAVLFHAANETVYIGRWMNGAWRVDPDGVRVNSNTFRLIVPLSLVEDAPEMLKMLQRFYKEGGEYLPGLEKFLLKHKAIP